MGLSRIAVQQACGSYRVRVDSTAEKEKCHIRNLLNLFIRMSPEYRKFELRITARFAAFMRIYIWKLNTIVKMWPPGR